MNYIIKALGLFVTGFSASFLSHSGYPDSFIYLFLGYSEVSKKERVWNSDLRTFFPKGPDSEYVRLCKPYTAYSSCFLACFLFCLWFFAVL